LAEADPLGNGEGKVGPVSFWGQLWQPRGFANLGLPDLQVTVVGVTLGGGFIVGKPILEVAAEAIDVIRW
jgi:hypothetical protein